MGEEDSEMHFAGLKHIMGAIVSGRREGDFERLFLKFSEFQQLPATAPIHIHLESKLS